VTMSVWVCLWGKAWAGYAWRELHGRTLRRSGKEDAVHSLFWKNVSSDFTGNTTALQQEGHPHVPRDPDRRAPRPPRRARQARRVRGHQGRHQVHLVVVNSWAHSRSLSSIHWCSYIHQNGWARLPLSGFNSRQPLHQSVQYLVTQLTSKRIVGTENSVRRVEPYTINARSTWMFFSFSSSAKGQTTPMWSYVRKDENSTRNYYIICPRVIESNHYQEPKSSRCKL